jgi:hypothetical protein
MPNNTATGANTLHAFRTFMGLPPDDTTPPACGATLSADYTGAGKPHCAACARLMRLEKGGGR